MQISDMTQWILGNTFPSVVFSSFGAFWLTFGFTLQPRMFAFANYAPGQPPDSQAGLAVPAFNNAFGKSTNPALMTYYYLTLTVAI